MTSGDADAPDESTETALSSTAVEEALIAKLCVPAESFVLGETLSDVPEATVEFEQLVPTSGAPLPFLWMSGADAATFEAAAVADSSVGTIRRRANLTDGYLYRIDWSPSADGLLRRLADGEEVLLQAEGHDGTWTLKTRAGTREAFAEFREFCHDNDISFDLRRLYDLTAPKLGQYNVSEKQRDAIVTAHELGYFDIPRDATLEDVADALGISARAASERLRRGQSNLVSSTLTIGTPLGVGVEKR